MNLKNIANNRTVMIILVAVIIGGYIFIRTNRAKFEEKVEEKRPQYLTREFADSQLENAAADDQNTAYQLLEDADMYMESRQVREAGSAYLRAIAIYPDGKAYFKYAGYLHEMTRYTWAMETLRLAESLGYDNGAVDYELAKIYSDMELPFEAIEHLTEALESGGYSAETAEAERAFDIIRKSVITKRRYESLIVNF